MNEKSALLCLAISSLSCHQVSSFLTPNNAPLSRAAAAFVVPSPSLAAPRIGVATSTTTTTTRTRASSTRLWAINLDSNDAFEILDLKPTPDLDKKQIKRAYKRMALKYHPDVATNQSSTKEEKRKASDIFAKINWAYETLSGKNGAAPPTGAAGAGSSSTSSTGAGGGYQPPHRRTSSYTSPNASTDWKDYMPKYEDDEKYDADGDSFGSIFSDLFSSAAVGAATGGGGGGGGVFRDFVDFLEGNVDGYGSGDSSNDEELVAMLATGTLEEVGYEMDDTELVVTQLSSKMTNINDELFDVLADLKLATKYTEKMDLEERVAELEARKKVVKGYVGKARKRLVSLQMRYKELIVGGANDQRAGGRSSRSSSSPSSSPASSSGYSASGYRSNASERATSSSSSTSSTGSSSSSSTESDEDAWKRQGFGSSGRRGSSRRRRSPSVDDEPRRSRRPDPSPPRQQQQQQSEPSPKQARPEPTTYRPTPSSSSSQQRSSSSSSSSSSSNSNSNSNIPPHRRTTDFSRKSEDKKRMREIKVD
eukprot:CAMPEP_0119005066 /NCGR_PEP_ID=MMETSP1176-20130426/1508_1 /TAXON_ID=265551 /ORGANISM="Synedropsis recta cf, Strain CCMP1620" /LENGTH=535 /DNA_ID=CAMNT_0006956833 /DNA_START=80 /DNA_END=1684 /DNA_ORIENTATION=-